MVRVAFQGIVLAAVVAAAFLLPLANRANAAFPQPAWPNNDSVDVQRCTSAPGTGPQGLDEAVVYQGITGPGAVVDGNYISFTCNFGFLRDSVTAGVAVIVDYCGGEPAADTRVEGDYNTAAGQFSIRLQRKFIHQGALITITLFTNNDGPGGFDLQEMSSGSTNLADLNRPQGAVPCPNGGTTQNPGGNTGGWAVTLTADDTDLIAGNDFTLTATANKSTAGTGFAIFIQNNTDGGIVFCQNVTICTHKDFKNEPGARTYQAFIANAQGQDVQAASAPVVVGWNEWSGSITLVPEDDEVDAGEVVDMTATANPTINSTIYKIRIERQDGGHVPGECLESPCTKFDTYEFGVSHNYVAKVVRQDGTGLRATSPAVKVTWKATEEWEGRVALFAAGTVTDVAIGTYVVIEAIASPTLDSTDYVITITEQSAGGGGESFTCAEGSFERCTMVVKSDVETTRFFHAVVAKRDGSGNAKATSELVTVVWRLGANPRPCLDGWRATSVTGEARVLLGGRLRVPLKAGQWICPNDDVETGANSNVVGQYEERGLFNPNAGPEVGYQAKVEVKPSTRLALGFSGQSVTYTIINLATGRGEFFVDGARKSDFRIKSPTSVASVRGTGFSVDVDPITGHTYIEVYHGEVLVEPNNPDLDDVILGPGDSVLVGHDDISDVEKFYGALGHKRTLPQLRRDGSN